MRTRRALALAAALAALFASPARAADVARGRILFVDGCSSCHGLHANGVQNLGPSLRDAGAAAADFYLSTGRMPLDQPGKEPERTRVGYDPLQIADLVAYIASLGSGPSIPQVDPARGNLSQGLHAFTDHCAGCHQVVARGGVVTGGFSPTLQRSTPTQIGEAVRVGPYLMPVFDQKLISAQELDSIARYVEWTRHPDNRGGWGLFDIGPVPEGMVAWLVGAALLVLAARLIGKRDTE